jgi:hypothetical protein
VVVPPVVVVAVPFVCAVHVLPPLGVHPATSTLTVPPVEPVVVTALDPLDGVPDVVEVVEVPVLGEVIVPPLVVPDAVVVAGVPVPAAAVVFAAFAVPARASATASARECLFIWNLRSTLIRGLDPGSGGPVAGRNRLIGPLNRRIRSASRRG